MKTFDEDFIAELVEGVKAGSDDAVEVRERLTDDETKLFDVLMGDKEMSAVKKKAVSKKTTAKKVTPKPNSTKVVPVKVEKSKREVAQEIFDKHFNKKPRKDILALFMSEAKLTKAGSSTYYANMKKKNEDTEL